MPKSNTTYNEIILRARNSLEDAFVCLSTLDDIHQKSDYRIDLSKIMDIITKLNTRTQKEPDKK